MTRFADYKEEVDPNAQRGPHVGPNGENCIAYRYPASIYGSRARVSCAEEVKARRCNRLDTAECCPNSCTWEQRVADRAFQKALRAKRRRRKRLLKIRNG